MEESLVLLDDIRAKSAQRELHYKRGIAKYHSVRVKRSGIKEGDLVLKKNEVSWVDPNRKLDPV